MTKTIRHFYSIANIFLGESLEYQMSFYSGDFMKERVPFELLDLENQSEILFQINQIQEIVLPVATITEPAKKRENSTFLGASYSMDKEFFPSCFMLLFYQNKTEIFDLEIAEDIFFRFEQGLLDKEINEARQQAIFVNHTEILAEQPNLSF